MKSSDEKVLVDAREVDSIGGAKPEPEERPAFLSAAVEGGKKPETSQGTVELNLEQPKRVLIESNVEEMTSLLGKHCRGCKFFNVSAGQTEIERRAYRGNEQERASIRELFATMEENHDGGGEIYLPDDESIFKATPGELGLAAMGQCDVLKGLMHPDCHCAGPVEGKGDLWEARDSTIARVVAAQRDAVLGTAAGKIAGAPTP